MRLPALASLALAAATLTGCGTAQDDAAPQAAPTSDQTPAPQARETGEADAVGTQAQGDAPDLSPADLTPEAEKGEKGARNVLLSFARAIELKQFGQAYDLMRGQAHDSTNESAFAARFDDFGKITVSSQTGLMEGAAGTIYYTAPITITGSSGKELAGDVVLSRVDDVPGASPESLRWSVRNFNVK